MTVLAIDIGNTNVKYGLYRDGVLTEVLAGATDRIQTADEYGVLLTRLVRWQVGGCIISSVVPPVTEALSQAVRRYLGVEPLVVRPGIKTGLVMRYETPQTLGADRVVASVAAAHRYGAPVLALSFGTATVFNVVDAEGAFLGGAIAPGLRVAADAMSRSAARLTQVELTAPPSVIGRTTQQAIQAGAVYGFVGLVEGIVARLRASLPAGQHEAPVVATGGLVNVVAPLTRSIDHVEPDLTLAGLHLLWEMNR